MTKLRRWICYSLSYVLCPSACIIALRTRQSHARYQFSLAVLPVLPVVLDWSLSHHDNKFVLYFVLCVTFPVGLPQNSILQLE